MIVRNKKTFGMGAVFAISFLSVLFLIFSPVFGGKNGLQFADDSFNRLSKGSSYFIPKVTKSNEQFMGRMFSTTIKVDKPEDKPGDAEKRAANIAKVLTTAGAKAEVNAATVKIEGDLGKVLASALQDSDDMFKNNGEKIKARYSTDDEKKMFRQWHNALAKIMKEFQKEKKIEEAKIVSDVMKKAVEPAYNFYKVEGQKVVDHAGMMSGLLVFYVAYTMWWGYAIFYLFDGLGLSMKKAKVKKEA
ncbi:conserved hypothetical protein [Candidatus Sulfobium mesophilum]|uniref:Uncharacterized protein n=1 Tax=Candidatus Sulfobium mesophilum TaxID=2016548 RepID=A0A2U3QKM3_9BACT|nr:conserved hypothetical protein [Candidatus Sulfobium mesophilum]